MEYLEQVKKWAKRRKEIVKMREQEKKTYQEIADLMEISRQRAERLYKQEVEKCSVCTSGRHQAHAIKKRAKK